MQASEQLWGTTRFDLMQIHNLLDWEAHLETLLDWKAQGRVRYIGITTSHGRRHEELEKVMASQPVDFVQFTYNILDREAEERLLPLAAERGLAVIVNRPFRRGALFDMFERRALPEWAGEIDCANWAQFFLKFIVSHPAVTCAIPATSRVDHMRQNMGAAHGRLPDAALRALAPRLGGLQLDDSRGGVHEHLLPGDGELDFAALARAAHDVGFDGIASVELPRHGHDPVTTARAALEVLAPLFRPERS